MPNSKKTSYQNNFWKKFKINLDARLKFKNGKTYIVTERTRDIEGNPLYNLKEFVSFNGEILIGISEENLLENL